MECLWRLFRYRQPYGYCYQPYPAIFYLYFIAHNGLSYYYLYGTRFLEKYEEVRKSGEKKSVVLFVTLPTSLRETIQHTALAFRRVF